jgi:hypothetical protein
MHGLAPVAYVRERGLRLAHAHGGEEDAEEDLECALQGHLARLYQVATVPERECAGGEVDELPNTPGHAACERILCTVRGGRLQQPSVLCDHVLPQVVPECSRLITALLGQTGDPRLHCCLHSTGVLESSTDALDNSCAHLNISRTMCELTRSYTHTERG